MGTAEEIAASVWAFTPRTLASGSPPSPVTYLDTLAEAVWGYATRTIVPGAAVTATAGLRPRVAGNTTVRARVAGEASVSARVAGNVSLRPK